MIMDEKVHSYYNVVLYNDGEMFINVRSVPEERYIPLAIAVKYKKLVIDRMLPILQIRICSNYHTNVALNPEL